MKFIENWKVMIPTWFICIWFCLWIYPVAAVIGIALLVVQYKQKQKLYEMAKNGQEADSLKEEIAELNTLLEKKERIIKDQEEELNEYVNCMSEYKDDVEQDNAQKIRVIESLESNQETLKNNIAKRDAVIKKMMVGMYENMYSKFDDLCKEYDDLIKKVNDKKQEIENLKTEYYKKESLLISEYEHRHNVMESEFIVRNRELEQNYNNFVDEEKEKRKYIEKIMKQLDAEISHKKGELASIVGESEKVKNEIHSMKEEIKILNSELVEKYNEEFSDFINLSSQECKNELTVLKAKENSLTKSDCCVFEVGPYREDKFVERSSRQILRNFNSDCTRILSGIKSNNIDVIRNRIRKSFETLNELYSVDGVELSEEILYIKLEEATLLYTYEIKSAQEKAVQKSIKEQMMEEAKAEREIEEQKKKIEKDLQQHVGEVNRLMKYLQKTSFDEERQLYISKINELEEKIKSLNADKEKVLEREANAKAGFVYIISNIGSFGEDIYKIGMTRRLEPMDRIRELSSASVPFEFDVHAMIFSSDAPELENMLHKHFADRAVNKVNPRKEFFNVNIDEIEKVVKEKYNETVQFTKIPIAEEYRQSLYLAEMAP